MQNILKMLWLFFKKNVMALTLKFKMKGETQNINSFLHVLILEVEVANQNLLGYSFKLK